jgi:hypothetical protein
MILYEEREGVFLRGAGVGMMVVKMWGVGKGGFTKE